MRETIELRLGDDVARRLVGNELGDRMGPGGMIRAIELQPDDPLIAKFKAAESEACAGGQTLFTYWERRRRYTSAELAAAELIHLRLEKMFEPAGEECGTLYDYSSACAVCGAGRRQASDLILDMSRIPRQVDVAFTIARDEWVASHRLGEAIRANGLTGARLLPVRDLRGGPEAEVGWSQLSFESKAVIAGDPTSYGDGPFEGGTNHHFGPGHVAGVHVRSELYVKRASWDGNDLVRTRDLIGVRRGLVAPHPLLLISQRAWHLLHRGGFKGFTAEVAHLD